MNSLTMLYALTGGGPNLRPHANPAPFNLRHSSLFGGFAALARLPFAFVALVSAATLPARAQEPTIEYNRDIRPIFADNCLACHGQDSGSRKAKLRLDLREDALIGGKSGLPALVPGKPDESELLLRAASPHDDEMMPPLDSNRDRLKPDALAKLRTWIAEGAEYQPHWAFVAPKRPKIPAGNDASPLDRLVNAKRSAVGLQASPEAAPETLCRRVWLDLTGLPPSTSDVDAFVANYAAKGFAAYTELVDTLLASPRYGEKWARVWLDAARYSDSDGYEKDLPRQQWAWRDWVIQALNTDKPYDSFVIEQIAGDLLVEPAQSLQEQQDLRVATGFLRNSMVSEEGAIVAEQYRKEAMFDRLDCLGKAVLGITLQCAQCHTHKFDPITHDDYFRIFSAIDNTYEATTRVYTPVSLSLIDQIKQSVVAGDTRAKAARPTWEKDLEAWTAALTTATPPWNNLKPIEPVWEGGLSHPDALPDASVITLGFRPTDGELSFTAKPPEEKATGLRLEALTHGDLIFGGPGRNLEGLFAVTELIVESQAAGEKTWEKHALVKATADFESPDRPIPAPYKEDDNDKRRTGPASFLVDGNNETAWSPDRGAGRGNVPIEVIVEFAEPVAFREGTIVRCTLRFKHGGRDSHGRQTNHLGRFRIALTSATAPFSPPMRADVRIAAALPAAERSPAQRDLLFAAWRETVSEFAEINASIDTAWAKYPSPETTVLNLAARIPEEARQTFRLDRGAWDKPKEPLTFGTPSFLPPAKRTGEPARLEFARWLVDRDSPTAARVEVNRVWQALFGTGLLDTPEDFGVRAAMPVQEPLLDWLAVDLMEQGWSRKKLIRQIVLSNTYRQSSTSNPELQERDPRNRYFARGPRFRADAEVVRDLALSVSGLLHENVGGPSVFPPVPQNMFAESFIKVDFWKTATGPDRYRRSLYVFRRRSMPDPVLATFDAPTGDSACVARARSNTPLAALTALNETIFVEAAQAFALRVLREGGATDAERAVYAFRLCTSRRPEKEEIAYVLDLVRTSRARMVDGWIPARVVAFGDGDKLPKLPPNTTPNDAAAWTIAGRVLFNLDETLSKN